MTNTKKLRALILERGLTQEQVAANLGITPASLNYKINNKREFKASEIKALVELLNIPDGGVTMIFFTPDVDL